MVGLGGNIDHFNPVEVDLNVVVLENNTNEKFKLFRVGGWLDYVEI